MLEWNNWYMYSIRYIVVIINFCNVLIVVCVKAVSRCISASGFMCIKPGFSRVLSTGGPKKPENY